VRKVIIIILFHCSLLTFAQDTELLESINFQKAVLGGTRTRDGRPGPKYWQNHADYDISVRLDTAEKRIYGMEHVTYYNNSPDQLTNIVIRLYQNRNKKGASEIWKCIPVMFMMGLYLTP
jgi:hypothetical protein